MELVPAAAGGGSTDSQSVQIDPAARRIANIQTVAVEAAPSTRTIRAIGELSYNEATLRTISAYVDGRLERLHADYTGVVVAQGDKLALVYSPKLYSSQAEFLLAKKARDKTQTSTLARVHESNDELYQSAKQRLIEMGMTASQIEELERTGQADSRLHLLAPMSGTVIEKLAVEGEYVKEGEAIYRLADLSSVWLMLELFPCDAAHVQLGQQVAAEVQSLPGRSFLGRVEFIDPQVNPNTRTVGVRVVIENEQGVLRIGDYAKAKIAVGMEKSKHSDATRMFVTDQPNDNAPLVIPRSALLSAGESSVVYVETEPGRFEIRRVVLGSRTGDQVVVLKGLKLGEQVATRGNFLIDSQMQLAGNPSLIDPSRAEARLEEAVSPEMIAALESLPLAERQLAESQRICPVTMMALGSMGTPQKVDVNGQPVFICCEGCRASLLEEPAKYLAKLATDQPPQESEASSSTMNLPPIGDMKPVEPQSGLPPIEAPQPVIIQDIPVNQVQPVAETLREVVR
jgi:RND family efflux transporter MFP subunit